jgi:hypothetical protein
MHNDIVSKITCFENECNLKASVTEDTEIEFFCNVTSKLLDKFLKVFHDADYMELGNKRLYCKYERDSCINS